MYVARACTSVSARERVLQMSRARNDEYVETLFPDARARNTSFRSRESIPRVVDFFVLAARVRPMLSQSFTPSCPTPFGSITLTLSHSSRLSNPPLIFVRYCEKNVYSSIWQHSVSLCRFAFTCTRRTHMWKCSITFMCIQNLCEEKEYISRTRVCNVRVHTSMNVCSYVRMYVCMYVYARKLVTRRILLPVYHLLSFRLPFLISSFFLFLFFFFLLLSFSISFNIARKKYICV